MLMTNENQLVIINICTVTYYLTRVVKKNNIIKIEHIFRLLKNCKYNIKDNKTIWINIQEQREKILSKFIFSKILQMQKCVFKKRDVWP